MIKSITYLFLLLLSFTGNAQDISIEWGKMQQRSGDLIKIMPFYGKDFYTLRWKGTTLFGGYSIARHDDLKFSKDKKVVKSVHNSMANFEQATTFNDHVIVILSDSKTDEEILYLQEYGYDLKPKGDAIQIASRSNDNKVDDSPFEMLQSNNKKYLGFIYKVSGKNATHDEYEYKVFNQNLESISEGEFTLQFKADFAKLSMHMLTNQGDIILAVKEFSEEKSQQGVFNTYLHYKSMHIFQLRDDNYEDYELDVDGVRVKALTMNTDTSQFFTICGVYGGNEEPGAKGLFYLKLDYKNKKILQSGFNEFDRAFILEDLSETEQRRAERREQRGKGSPSLYNYKMRDVHILDDGSIVGSLEQHFVQVYSNSNVNGVVSSTSHTYYYNDIITFKIGTKGNYEWLNKIEKSQVSSNDGGPYSSYASFRDGNWKYFFFNDSKENYTNSGQHATGALYTAKFNKKDNVVAIVALDLTTGMHTRKVLFDQIETETLALPKAFIVDYNAKEMLLYTIKRSKEKYGIVKW